MVTEKYGKIAEILKTRILSGGYSGKFPSEIALSQEFQVSTRTIAKVFAVLKAENLILPTSHGTRVAPRFRQAESPGVVLLGFREPHNLPLAQDRLFNVFSRCIEEAGYQFRLVDQTLAGWAEAVAAWRPVGAAFAYCSYSAEAGALLRQAGIPHIALNRYRADFPAFWVDVDWDHIIDQLCGQLARHGIRRAALPMLYSEREGSRGRYLENAASWRRATARYGMADYSHDWRELQCDEPPEVLVLFERGQFPELREWYRRTRHRLTVLNFASDVPLAQENCLRYAGFDYGEIARAGWALLSALLRGQPPEERKLLLKFSVRILFNNTA